MITSLPRKFAILLLAIMLLSMLPANFASAQSYSWAGNWEFQTWMDDPETWYLMTLYQSGTTVTGKAPTYYDGSTIEATAAGNKLEGEFVIEEDDSFFWINMSLDGTKFYGVLYIKGTPTNIEGRRVLTYIRGDVLEALFLPIPPGEGHTAGYVRAINSTGGIFTSTGVKNTSLCWDEDGAYQIAVPPDTYEVWAWAPCYIPAETKKGIVVKEDENTTGINFRLAPSLLRVDFLVVDGQGSVVEGATINITDASTGFNMSTRTDSGGESWLQLEGTMAPCSAWYTLTVTKGTLTATTTIYLAIAYCQNNADPGNATLTTTTQFSWEERAFPLAKRVKVVLGEAGTIPTPTPTPTSSGEVTLLGYTTFTLTADSPSKSYYYNLAEGDAVTMDVGVSGDPANLYVFDSAGTQVYSQIGIDIDPVFNWVAPYADMFEFMVTTTGAESRVDMKIQYTPQQSSSNLLYIVLAVAVVAVVVVLAVVLLLLSRKKVGTTPPPPLPIFQTEASQSVPLCPTCGYPLSFVQEYQRWYCTREQKYV